VDYQIFESCGPARSGSTILNSGPAKADYGKNIRGPPLVSKWIKLGDTLLAHSLVKHLMGDEAAGLNIIGAKPNEAPKG
jgi:hypothetical protein